MSGVKDKFMSLNNFIEKTEAKQSSEVSDNRISLTIA